MEKSLDKFKVGERGRVLRVLGDGALRRRLFDMGLTPTAEIILKKLAPLGDPIEINIRGYELTLRKNEALNIIMKSE